MKKKRLILSCFMLLTFILGLTNIKALSYTTYKEGDKVQVKVNNTTTLSFIVLNNAIDTNAISAIYDGVLGDPVRYGETTGASSVRTITQNLTSTWSNVIEKRLPKLIDVLGTAQNADVDTQTTSAIFHIKKNYWLEDAFSNPGESTLNVAQATNMEAYTRIHTVTESATEKAYVRPYIVVSKSNIVGGTYLSDDEKLLQDFGAKYKALDELKDETVVITTTPTTLHIKATNAAKTVTELDFTYANGILTYVAPTTDNEKTFEGYYVSLLLNTISKIKNYNLNDLYGWLGKQDGLTITKDGIQYTSRKLEINQSGKEVSLNLYDNYKLDIKNGIKTYVPSKTDCAEDKDDKEETEVENPDTGIVSIGVGAILVLLGGIGFYIKFRKCSKFPQSM